MKTMHSLFIVKNLEAQKDFYTSVFKFEVVFDSDWYVHLKKDTIEIAFMIENADNQPKFLHAPQNGKGVLLTFEYNNVEEFYNQVKDDIDVIYELKVEEWGQKHFMAQDPAGIMLDFVEYVE